MATMVPENMAREMNTSLNNVAIPDASSQVISDEDMWKYLCIAVASLGLAAGLAIIAIFVKMMNLLCLGNNIPIPDYSDTEADIVIKTITRKDQHFPPSFHQMPQPRQTNSTQMEDLNRFSNIRPTSQNRHIIGFTNPAMLHSDPDNTDGGYDDKSPFDGLRSGVPFEIAIQAYDRRQSKENRKKNTSSRGESRHLSKHDSARSDVEDTNQNWIFKKANSGKSTETNNVNDNIGSDNLNSLVAIEKLGHDKAKYIDNAWTADGTEGVKDVDGSNNPHSDNYNAYMNYSQVTTSQRKHNNKMIKDSSNFNYLDENGNHRSNTSISGDYDVIGGSLKSTSNNTRRNSIERREMPNSRPVSQSDRGHETLNGSLSASGRESLAIYQGGGSWRHIHAGVDNLNQSQRPIMDETSSNVHSSLHQGQQLGNKERQSYYAHSQRKQKTDPPKDYHESQIDQRNIDEEMDHSSHYSTINYISRNQLTQRDNNRNQLRQSQSDNDLNQLRRSENNQREARRQKMIKEEMVKYGRTSQSSREVDDEYPVYSQPNQKLKSKRTDVAYNPNQKPPAREEDNSLYGNIWESTNGIPECYNSDVVGPNMIDDDIRHLDPNPSIARSSVEIRNAASLYAVLNTNRTLGDQNLRGMNQDDEEEEYYRTPRQIDEDLGRNYSLRF